MSRLSVVIPVLNEREAIGEVVERLLTTRDELRRRAGIADLEVLVVDDGSSDGTHEVVSALAARCHDRRATVRLIRHRRNRGYGAALQTGFDAARGSLLAFLDGDSTYPPEELPALCEVAVRSNAQLVLGDRMSSRSSRMPPLRRVGNVALAWAASVLSGRRIADCCSGMRVMPAATWRALRPLPAGLDFTPAMTVRALHRRLTLREVVISYDVRVGRSKLSVVRDGLRFLGTILRETQQGNPSRLRALLWPVLALVVGLGTLAGSLSAWSGGAAAGAVALTVLAGLLMALALAGWNLVLRLAPQHLGLPRMASDARSPADEERGP
ncbi:MAG: glycosyltransferase family 2 protein [Anaerolineae bacterium]